MRRRELLLASATLGLRNSRAATAITLPRDFGAHPAQRPHKAEPQQPQRETHGWFSESLQQQRVSKPHLGDSLDRMGNKSVPRLYIDSSGWDTRSQAIWHGRMVMVVAGVITLGDCSGDRVVRRS